MLLHSEYGPIVIWAYFWLRVLVNPKYDHTVLHYQVDCSRIYCTFFRTFLSLEIHWEFLIDFSCKFSFDIMKIKSVFTCVKNIRCIWNTYMFLFDLCLLKLGAASYSTLLICMLYILQTHRSRDSFSAVFTRFDFDKTLNTTAKPSLIS